MISEGGRRNNGDKSMLTMYPIETMQSAIQLPVQALQIRNLTRRHASIGASWQSTSSMTASAFILPVMEEPGGAEVGYRSGIAGWGEIDKDIGGDDEERNEEV